MIHRLAERFVYRLHTNFQIVYRIYHDTVRIIETDDIVEKTDGTMGVQMLILICVFSKFELASIKKVDRYNEDNEHHVTTTERSDVLPLLANKANDT
ncbi:hypothetical protein Tco_1471051, partial [Tanacetum coccineum]